MTGHPRVHSASSMSRTLATLLAATDAVFVAYWSISSLAILGVVHLPPALMYAGYGQRTVGAWNWSFLPLDLMFSAFGLAAVGAARRGRAIWRPLALLSLALTMVAGLMAVSYWTLLCEFDPAWFLPNLALVLWPMAFMPRLVCELSAVPRDRPT